MGSGFVGVNGLTACAVPGSASDLVLRLLTPASGQPVSGLGALAWPELLQPLPIL